jgi:hypothetical protein
MNTKELLELSNSAWFEPTHEFIKVPVYATNGTLLTHIVFEKVDGKGDVEWVSHTSHQEMVEIVQLASKNKKECIPKEAERERKEHNAYEIALQINGQYICNLTLWSAWSDEYISEYAKCCAIDELGKPDVMREKFGFDNVPVSQIVRTIYVPEKLINVIVQFAIFINKKGN